MKCIVEIPEQFPTTFVSGEFRRNIYLTVKEALHNVVKHANATEVNLKIIAGPALNIQIKDNGTGFDKSAVRSFSNGLSNMEFRIKAVGGLFEIINEKARLPDGQGTFISIKVPLLV